MSDVEDAGGSAGPTPVRVNEVGTTKVACSMLSSVGFEDVVSRLKAFEERIRGDDGGEEQQLVMFTRVTGSGGTSSSSGSGSGGRCDGGSGAGSFNGGRCGAGSSNDAGGQRVIFTRSNGGCESSGGGRNTSGSSGGGSGGSAGAGSSRDGRNTGGGGVSDGYGVSGFCRERRKGMGSLEIINRRVLLIMLDQVHQVDPVQVDLGQKPKVLINPIETSPITNPILIPTQNETIGSNQVQGNAELDWNQRYL